MNRDDLAAINSGSEALTHAAHALTQTLYGAAGQAQGFDPGRGRASSGPSRPGEDDDDVVDAEFKDVA